MTSSTAGAAEEDKEADANGIKGEAHRSTESDVDYEMQDGDHDDEEYSPMAGDAHCETKQGGLGLEAPKKRSLGELEVFVDQQLDALGVRIGNGKHHGNFARHTPELVPILIKELRVALLEFQKLKEEYARMQAAMDGLSSIGMPNLVEMTVDAVFNGEPPSGHIHWTSLHDKLNNCILGRRRDFHVNTYETCTIARMAGAGTTAIDHFAGHNNGSMPNFFEIPFADDVRRNAKSQHPDPRFVEGISDLVIKHFLKMAKKQREGLRLPPISPGNPLLLNYGFDATDTAERMDFNNQNVLVGNERMGALVPQAQTLLLDGLQAQYKQLATSLDEAQTSTAQLSTNFKADLAAFCRDLMPHVRKSLEAAKAYAEYKKKYYADKNARKGNANPEVGNQKYFMTKNIDKQQKAQLALDSLIEIDKILKATNISPYEVIMVKIALKAATLQRFTAATNFFQGIIQVYDCTLQAPIARHYYGGQMTAAQVEEHVRQVQDAVHDASGGCLAIGSFAWDGEHEHMRTGTFRHLAVTALESAKELTRTHGGRGTAGITTAQKVIELSTFILQNVNYVPSTPSTSGAFFARPLRSVKESGDYDDINDEDAEPQKGDYLKGRFIESTFEDGKTFVGEVVSFFPQSGLYSITYTDGDTEDMTEDEILALLLDNSVTLATVHQQTLRKVLERWKRLFQRTLRRIELGYDKTTQLPSLWPHEDEQPRPECIMLKSNLPSSYPRPTLEERMRTPTTPNLGSKLLEMFSWTMRPDPLPFRLRKGFNVRGPVKKPRLTYEDGSIEEIDDEDIDNFADSASSQLPHDLTDFSRTHGRDRDQSIKDDTLNAEIGELNRLIPHPLPRRKEDVVPRSLEIGVDKKPRLPVSLWVMPLTIRVREELVTIYRNLQAAQNFVLFTKLKAAARVRKVKPLSKASRTSLKSSCVHLGLLTAQDAVRQSTEEMCQLCTENMPVLLLKETERQQIPGLLVRKILRGPWRDKVRIHIAGFILTPREDQILLQHALDNSGRSWFETEVKVSVLEAYAANIDLAKSTKHARASGNYYNPGDDPVQVYDTDHLVHRFVASILKQPLVDTSASTQASPDCVLNRSRLLEAANKTEDRNLIKWLENNFDGHSHAVSRQILTSAKLVSALRDLNYERDALVLEIFGRACEAWSAPCQTESTRSHALHLMSIMVYRFFGDGLMSASCLRSENIGGVTTRQLLNFVANADARRHVLEKLEVEERRSLCEKSMSTILNESSFSFLSNNSTSGHKQDPQTIQQRSTQLDVAHQLKVQSHQGGSSYGVRVSKRQWRNGNNKKDHWHNESGDRAAYDKDIEERARQHTGCSNNMTVSTHVKNQNQLSG